jgi:hypothetical protein
MRRTEKIDNVRTYAVLSPKFLTIQLRVLEVVPEESFGGCECSAEFVSTAIAAWDVAIRRRRFIQAR